MTTKTSRLAIIIATSLLSGATGVSACASRTETAIKPCPCASGYVCCDSGVCAQDQSGCSQATAALSASASGQWTGYIENFQLSTDDSITVSIAAADDGTLSGTVRIGHGPPPPPATDGSTAWPAEVQGVDAIVPVYIPGFAYSVEDVSWQARRLKFRIPKYQPWQPWCALQQPYEQTHCADPPACTTYESDGFSCSPSAGAVTVDAQGGCHTVATATTPSVAIDCAKGTLCDTIGACNCQSGGCVCGGFGVCACDATGCRAGSEWMSVPIGYWFDIAFDGGKGDGSVNLSAGGNELHNVRLTRTGQAVGPGGN